MTNNSLLASLVLLAATTTAALIAPNAAAATPQPTSDLFSESLTQSLTESLSESQSQSLPTALPESIKLPTGIAGTDVDSIKDIETLSNWTTLTSKHLTLQVNRSQQYLLTLQDHCQHLRGARLVGVSMTNQEIWADFDHVAADGYECRIDQITRLTLD